MKAVVNPSVLEGRVKAIASKSHAHRILICAAFADKPTIIICEESSDDIKATVSCLSNMGADIKELDNGYLVNPINKDILKHTIDIDCNESGSTLRFLQGVGARHLRPGQTPSLSCLSHEG